MKVVVLLPEDMTGWDAVTESCINVLMGIAWNSEQWMRDRAVLLANQPGVAKLH